MSYYEYPIKPEAFKYLIIILVVLLCIIYLTFFYRKSNDLSNTVIFSKICFYFSIIIGFSLVFYLQIIEIFICQGVSVEKSESWLFTVINALLIGAFLLIAGIFSENNTIYIKYSILVFLGYLAITGFGYLGIKIVFNAPISDYLNYNTIQSNSSKMARFLTFNIVIFTLIMFITFIVEQEKEE